MSSRIDIVVIENTSKRSDKIRKLINKLGNEGKIKRYYQFHTNIANSAYDIVLSAEVKNIKRADRIILTDGDVTMNDDWLDEEIEITNQPEIFACGAAMSLHNLPIKTFPEAPTWIPAPTFVTKLYEAAPTGVHLLMFKPKNFLAMKRWMDDNNAFFIDDRMHYYCSNIAGKTWARTRKSIVTHLTWDLYNDKNHPYTKLKRLTPFDDIWRKKRSASYELIIY